MPESIFKQAKEVFRRAQKGEWQPMTLEDAGTYLMTTSREYHDTGDLLKNILSHADGPGMVAAALNDAGYSPAKQLLDYSGVDEARLPALKAMMYSALMDSGLVDPKTHIYSAVEVSPSTEDIHSPDMMIIADARLVDWKKIAEKIDFYERGMKDRGVFSPVKYAGEDYVMLAEDRPALASAGKNLLSNVKATEVWLTPEREVIPREAQTAQGWTQKMRDAERPEEMRALLNELMATRRERKNPSVKPEGAVAVKIYPTEQVVKELNALGVEIAEIKRG